MSQRGDDNKINIRLEDGMRARLKDQAKANNRSLNAEVVARLSGSGAGIRDQIAMRALCALITTDKRVFNGDFVAWGRYAVEAYKIADAMLKAREAQP